MPEWVGTGANPEHMLQLANRVLSAEQERDTLRAEVAVQRGVVEAAKVLRRTTGALNKHTGSCQRESCSVCDDLRDMELDAAMELDMQLAALVDRHA